MDALGTGVSLLALRPLQIRQLFRCEVRVEEGIPLLTFFTLDALWARFSLWALWALRTTWVTFVPLGALKALGAGVAFFALLPIFSPWPLDTLWTFRPSLTLLSLVPLDALGSAQVFQLLRREITVAEGVSLLPLVSFLAPVALVAFGASRSRFARFPTVSFFSCPTDKFPVCKLGFNGLLQFGDLSHKALQQRNLVRRFDGHIRFLLLNQKLELLCVQPVLVCGENAETAVNNSGNGSHLGGWLIDGCATAGGAPVQHPGSVRFVRLNGYRAVFQVKWLVVIIEPELHPPPGIPLADGYWLEIVPILKIKIQNNSCLLHCVASFPTS